MKNKKYTHLFFDLDNTLWDFEKNSCSAMQETFTEFNLHEKQIGFGQFFEIFTKHNRQLWMDYRKGFVFKKELTRLRFQKTFEELGISGISPDEMNSAYLAEMPKHKGLVDGALELLNYLKAKGYKLFILTNGFREVQHEKLAATGLKHYFTKIFISEEIKAPKPAREIFEYALKSANAKKRASIMIGDDEDVDVNGAMNFGMDAIWFNPQRKATVNAENFSCNNDCRLFIVKSLAELQTFF